MAGKDFDFFGEDFGFLCFFLTAYDATRSSVMVTTVHSAGFG